MKKTTLLFYFLTFVFLSHISYAQTDVKNLKQGYEKWLSETGLNSGLTVHNVEQNENGFVALELKFLFTDAEISASAWQQFKRNFDSAHHYQLEALLFYQALGMLKIMPDKLGVKIKDTYHENAENCIYIGIIFDTENRKLKIVDSFCKSVRENFPIDFEDIKVKSIAFNLENQEQNRKDIYKTILKWAKKEYKNKGRFSSATYYEGNDTLTFEVSHLKSEIIEEEDGWTCDLLKYLQGQDACKTSEYLKFKILYQPLSNKKARIICDIDARYSAGLYDVNQWPKMNVTEREFPDKIRTYTQKFTRSIYDELMK